MSLKENSVWSLPLEPNLFEPIVGIDLGTSNSCIAIWHKGKCRAKVLKNSNKRKLTPSTVSFRESFENVLVGESVENNKDAIAGFKRYLGLTGADITSNYTSSLLPSDLTTDNNDRVLMRCISNNRSGSIERGVSPEELSGHVLSYLIEAAEIYLKEKSIPGLPSDGGIHRAVIGVPANFTLAQRAATKRAAEKAGLTEVVLMVESTAAALGYGLVCAGSKTAMVFDMGGGTTDLTITTVTDDGVCTVEAVAGHGQCGGRDVDTLLLHFLLRSIEHFTASSRNVASPPTDKTNYEDSAIGLSASHCKVALLELCRHAKELLSTESTAEVVVPRELVRDLSSLQSSLTSSCYLLTPPRESPTWRPCMGQDHHWDEDASRGSVASLDGSSDGTEATEEGGGSYAECRVDETNQSFVLKVTRDELTCVMEPVLIEVSGVVSTGLDLFRLKKQGSSRSSVDSSVEITIDEVVLVGGSSRVLCVQEIVRRSLGEKGVVQFQEGKEFCASVNPDECVAQGLAVKGALLMGIDRAELCDILMLDALPAAIGVLSYDDEGAGEGTSNGENGPFFEPVLERGSRLPCRASKRLIVSDPTQKEISLDLYEELISGGDGGSGQVRYELMGTYDVSTQTAAVSVNGERSYVDVTLSIDENGVLRFDVGAVSGEETDGDVSSAQQKQAERQVYLLAMYIAFLLVVYVLVKLYITPLAPLMTDEEELQGNGETVFLGDSNTGGGESDDKSAKLEMLNSEFEF